MRPLIANLILAAGALAGALLACEGLTRLFAVSPRVYRMQVDSELSAHVLSENPLLGFEMKPNYRSEQADLVGNFPFVNAAGQRDIEHDVLKPAGKKRVVVLGDSVVVGFYLRELDALIARQLQAIVNRPDVEVLNFGVKGYNTRSEVELLKVRALPYQPDLVIVVFTDNDYSNISGECITPCAFPRPAIVNQLFVHSDLFRLISLRWDLFHFRAEVDPEYSVKRQAEAVRSDVRSDWGLEAAVRTLRDLGRVHGFTSIFVTWPAFSDTDIVNHSRTLAGDAPWAIERLAAQYGIPVYDLAPVFTADYVRRVAAAGGGESPPTPRGLYTFDGMHPTELGARVAATALGDIVREALSQPNAHSRM